MGFQTGMSGLSAAAKNLDVIGNNIANASTVGMKASRVEFSELVAAAIGEAGGAGSNAGYGLGVEVASVAQQFTQGNISVTGNNLDVAINGSGFFTMRMPDGSSAYSRDGQFKLNAKGELVSNKGASLMGYPTDLQGVPTSTTLQALTLPTGAPIPASATTSIEIEANLNSKNDTIYNSGTNTPPYTSYGTTMAVYDSQGAEIPFSLNFTRMASTPASGSDPATDNWMVRDGDGNPLLDLTSNPIILSFNSDGELVSTSFSSTDTTVTIDSPSPTTPDITANIDFTKMTQFASPFGITNLTKDGYASGTFLGVSISEDGLLTAKYSNGKSQASGMLALATFRNVQGLSPMGAGTWVETSASGQPLLGRPGQGKFGQTLSGRLEDSNVNLTGELVNMMTAQRAYQANAQTIKTQDQLMQTLMNMR